MRLPIQLFIVLVALTLLVGVGGRVVGPQATRSAPLIPDEVPAPVGSIDVVFVLDTTGSMSGLIEGAKRKIWSIAGQMASARPAPRIRMGLVAYRDRGDAYVTQRFELTTDIDALYGRLLEFAADGGGDGPESVNAALHDAVHRMDWTEGLGVYRVVFLVGDAPPHMDYADDVPFPVTLAAARQRGIVVNAIQCGNLGQTTPVWRRIAREGAGQYAAIPQDGGMVAVNTPMDDELARLNAALSRTVIPWGDASEKEELESKARRASRAPASVAASRLSYFARSAEGAVNSGRADLLDALARGETQLEEVPAESLPPELQPMSAADRKRFVEGKSAERDGLRAKIGALVAEREAYLREQASGEGGDAFDQRILEILRDQAVGLRYDAPDAKGEGA